MCQTESGMMLSIRRANAMRDLSRATNLVEGIILKQRLAWQERPDCSRDTGQGAKS